MPKDNKRGKGNRPKPSLAALSSFASAKASTYDKQARKSKERALNSKVVNKYRKLKARLQAAGLSALPTTAAKEQQPGTAANAQPPRQQALQPRSQQAQQPDQRQKEHDGNRPKHSRKPMSQLQRIAQEKEAERAEAQRLREQQLQEAKRRKEEQVRAQQRRKQQAAQFRKRTRTGQPVMKYRIDKVLEQLQSGKV